jgi:hypothetical protein
MRKIVLFTLVLLLAGCAGASTPDGLYLMTRFWPSSGLEIKSYRFEGDHVVVNPVAAGKHVDLDAERAVNPKNVGTFKRDGADLVLTFDGKDQRAKFKATDHGCFDWNAGTFCPVTPFPSGTKLDGTFEGGASVGGGALISALEITFKPDGTYTTSSAVSYSSTSATSNVSGGSTGGERGTYAIDGTSLTLTPESGKPRTVSTFPYDDDTKGPQPRRLFFGGGMLKRIR